MGENFQDYSWNLDFEADFLSKFSLKMLNSADENNFFSLVSVNLKVLDNLTWIFFNLEANSKF